MGMTFVIDSLEEMCDLMCDNRLPKKGDAMDIREPKCCGECMYFLRDDDGPPVGKCQPTKELIPIVYAWSVRGRECPYKESRNA